MNKKIAVIFFYSLSIFAYGQNFDSLSNTILQEGLKLYKLERSAWISTDLVMKNSSNQFLFNGYLAYVDSSDVKTIFYHHDSFGTMIKFTSKADYKKEITEKDVILSQEDRPATKYEQQLIELRIRASNDLTKDTSFLKMYNNITLNVVFLDEKDKMKVYILSGTTASDIIPLGNDYLLIYDNERILKIKKKLHQNLILISTKNEELKNKNIFGSIHQHSELSSPYITPSDICTLLLYGDMVEWEKHIVVSKNYMSVFNLKERTLFISVLPENFKEGK